MPGLTRRPTKSQFKQFNLNGTGTEDLTEWRAVFVESMDPTEYTPAVALCGSWEEWQRFKREWPGFNNILEEWKLEQEVYIRSTAIRTVATDAKSKVSKSAASSAKWLAEGGYKKREVGRPSKEGSRRSIKVQERIDTEVKDDIERVLSANEVN